jgi:hypothetical protein
MKDLHHSNERFHRGARIVIASGLASIVLAACSAETAARAPAARVLAGDEVVVVRKASVCRRNVSQCQRRRYPRTDLRRLGPHATKRFLLRFQPQGAIFLSLHRARDGKFSKISGYGEGGQVADGPPLREWEFEFPKRPRTVRRANTLLVLLSRSPKAVRGFELRLR